MKTLFERGEVVKINFSKDENFESNPAFEVIADLITMSTLYVITAVSPDNNLMDDRVDLIDLKAMKIPLQTRGVGIPIKYLEKTGLNVLLKS